MIFVGKDGKIAETGTWKELLRIPNGKFAEYVKVQKLGKGGNEGNGEGEGGEGCGGGGEGGGATRGGSAGGGEGSTKAQSR